jgi:hypothetical protein
MIDSVRDTLFNLPYVTEHAIMRCPFGTFTDMLKIPSPTRRVKIGLNKMANRNDAAVGDNITSFGLCTSIANPDVAKATLLAAGTLTPQPCVPPLVGKKWGLSKTTVKNHGANALLTHCTLLCPYGGLIKFLHSGQGLHWADPIECGAEESNYDTELIEIATTVAGLAGGLAIGANVINAYRLIRDERYLEAGLTLVPGGTLVKKGAAKVAAKTLGKEILKETAKPKTTAEVLKAIGKGVPENAAETGVKAGIVALATDDKPNTTKTDDQVMKESQSGRIDPQTGKLIL